jgi:hypothetical protein
MFSTVLIVYRQVIIKKSEAAVAVPVSYNSMKKTDICFKITLTSSVAEILKVTSTSGIMYVWLSAFLSSKTTQRIFVKIYFRECALNIYKQFSFPSISVHYNTLFTETQIQHMCLYNDWLVGHYQSLFFI